MKMSDRDARWCESEDENGSAFYTFLPINHKLAASTSCDDDDASVNFKQNLRSRINRNRDISCVRETTNCSDEAKGTLDHHKNSSRSRRSLRLINLCLTTFLLICNVLVTSVDCDELLDAVGSRGHYTHTWGLQILGGEEVARQVATDHEMHFRGKVSFDRYLLSRII